MTIIVTDMNCGCCKLVIRLLLEAKGHTPVLLDDGQLYIEGSLTPEEIEYINSVLRTVGHDLVLDKNHQLVEKAALAVRTWVMKLENKDVKTLTQEQEKKQIKEIVYKFTRESYRKVSELFSDIMGMTIHHYSIVRRITRAKELIEEGVDLGTIAANLKYCTTGYFSRQFKEIEGMKPSEYKKLVESNWLPEKIYQKVQAFDKNLQTSPPSLEVLLYRHLIK
jgi:AraC-like DNA-binding protein